MLCPAQKDGFLYECEERELPMWKRQRLGQTPVSAPRSEREGNRARKALAEVLRLGQGNSSVTRPDGHVLRLPTSPIVTTVRGDCD